MKNKSYFLCIDVGTTRFKAAIVDKEGKFIEKSDYYYQDLQQKVFHNHIYAPDTFSKALKETLHKLDSEEMKNILAIGVTGHGQTFIPVDKDYKPTGLIVGYMHEEVKNYHNLVKEVEKDNPISLMYIPMALYYRDKYPDIFNKTRYLLTPSDYIILLLTGSVQTSVSSPSINPWSKESLKKFNLDVEKFPRFKYLGNHAGNTTGESKKLFGIKEGTPVFISGGDFAMGVLGSGAISPGKSYERFGTSAGINLCWNKEIKDNRILCYRHIFNRYWNISGIINTGGIVIDWASNILKLRKIPDTIEIKKDIPIFFPYLMGEKTPFWRSDLKAALFEIRDDITKENLLLSVITGIIFGLRESFEIIEKNGGLFNYPISISGWWGNVGWFVQLNADIIGKKYAVLESSDTELTGVASVLSYSTGIYSKLEDAVNNMVRIKQIFYSNPDKHRLYSKIYQKYLEIRGIYYGKSN